MARARRPDADPDAARRAEEGLRAIEAGGIPPAAEERLRGLAREGGGFFTSDLSVGEFLLVKETGFRPLTQVMGSCFYSVGWQSTPFGYGYGTGYAGWGASGTFELDVQSEAWNEARRLALGRLAQEAELAGADAVLGVEITRGRYDWAKGLIEFAAVGTAVVSERWELGEEVFLSSLSGQEFASLVRSGWLPVGICAGSTVAYVVGGGQTMQALSGYGARWQNQELTELTRGLYDARQLAMRRVERQAHELEAGGLVGVRIDQSQKEHEFDQQGYKRMDLVVTMHVIGTAVAPIAHPPEPPPTYIALSLSEERR
jgi:uncharacterized protein YbjQ (UPF0145 family)